MAAKFKLIEIIELAQKISLNNHIYGLQRAIIPVVKMFQLTENQAKKFIITELTQLNEHNFVRPVYYSNMKLTFDLYGKKIKNIPFYIKFTVMDDTKGKFLYIISFHPTEEALTTQSETLEKYEGEDI